MDAEMPCGISTTVTIVACKMRAQCQLSHHFQITCNVYQKFILPSVEVPAAELVNCQSLKRESPSRLAILHDCFPQPFPRILAQYVLSDLAFCVLNRPHFPHFRVFFQLFKLQCLLLHLAFSVVCVWSPVSRT